MGYELTPEERETHLNMTGDNHDEWEVFTDDPYWIRRFEKLGVEPFQKVGWGYKYRLRADQVLIRKGKPQISEATRLARAARLRNPHRAEVLET